MIRCDPSAANAGNKQSQAMGEPTVASPQIADKGEANGSTPAPQVSIAYGGFKHSDSLSSVSSNKYVKEREKCPTAGSVAEKKAFFEAHCRNVAARKAESPDQEKPIKALDVKLGEPSPRDLIINTFGAEEDSDGAAKKDGANTQTGAANSIVVEDSTEHAFVRQYQECGSSSTERNNEESDKILDSPNLKVSDEADPLKLQSCLAGSQRVTEAPRGRDNEKVDISKIDAEIVRLDPPRASPKKTLATKGGQNVAKVKKKSGSPIPISSQISASTPGGANLVSSFASPVSASHTSARKGSGLPSTRSHDSSARQHKKSVPTAPQISSSLDCARHDEHAPCTMAGHSSIMDKMSHKEIVKRAFRTFQKDYKCNQLKISVEDIPYAAKQVPTKVTELRVSTPRNSQEEHERSYKGGRVDPIRKSTGGAKSTFGFRSDERAEKHKQFVKKLEVKSDSKEVDKLRLPSKSKDEQEVEIKNIRQSLNFKATPMPDFYRGKRDPK